MRSLAVALSLALACATAHAPLVPPQRLNPLPSRQRDTQAGFFLQPAGLAEDYPEEADPVAKMRRDIAVLQRAGIRYLRFGIGWDSVESQPGIYDWSVWDSLFKVLGDAGIFPLPYVCYTPRWLHPEDPKDFWRLPAEPGRFASFMAAAVARYRDQARSWELWNEPDNDYYWRGTVEQYAGLVKAGAEAVRRADPTARVVLGGMSKMRSPFLEDLLRRFGLGSEVDVVNLHGYLETWDGARAEEYPARIEAVAELVGEKAPRADLWLAEFGYGDWRERDGRPSRWSYAVHDYEHTAAFQAVALFRAHVLALASQRLSLTIDDLPNKEAATGSNKHLGIVDVHGNPKPAFHALRLYQDLFVRPVRPADVQVRGGREAVVHVFEAVSGELIVAAWLRSSPQSGNPGGRARDTREETVAVRLPVGAGAELTAFDVETGQPIRTGAALDGPLLTNVRLRGGSIFVARIVPARPQR